MHRTVEKVLPDLPASIFNIVEAALQSLGVETSENFHFIQEADLLSVLRPIQARELVAAWKQTSIYIYISIYFFRFCVTPNDKSAFNNCS